MAWLVRHAVEGYILTDQHPIRIKDHRLFFSEAKSVAITPEQAAILLDGATLENGEYVQLRSSSMVAIKPGYYTADADGTFHWFERRPSHYDGQWYTTDGRSELVDKRVLEGRLPRIPTPDDQYPTQYGPKQAHTESLIGTDVLPAPASAELLARGLKPRKQLGYVLRRGHQSGALLTTHQPRAFEALRNHRYQPAFTLEDVLMELLTYGRVRLELLDDNRVLVEIDQSKNLYIDRNIAMALFGALLYANAMLCKEAEIWKEKR